MAHQHHEALSDRQEILNTGSQIFIVSAQTSGAVSRIAAPHVQLNETPFDILQLRREAMNVRRAIISLAG